MAYIFILFATMAAPGTDKTDVKMEKSPSLELTKSGTTTSSSKDVSAARIIKFWRLPMAINIIAVLYLFAHVFCFELQTTLGEIAIEASQIVSRLEQVAGGFVNADPSYNTGTTLLGPNKRDSDEIIQMIQNLIATDDEGEPIVHPVLDDISKLVITSHSFATYCGNLDRHVLQKLSTRFTTDTTRWFNQIFG